MNSIKHIVLIQLKKEMTNLLYDFIDNDAIELELEVYEDRRGG